MQQQVVCTCVMHMQIVCMHARVCICVCAVQCGAVHVCACVLCVCAYVYLCMLMCTNFVPYLPGKVSTVAGNKVTMMWSCPHTLSGLAHTYTRMHTQNNPAHELCRAQGRMHIIATCI